jgi:hypothetical protein
VASARRSSRAALSQAQGSNSPAFIETVLRSSGSDSRLESLSLFAVFSSALSKHRHGRNNEKLLLATRVRHPIGHRDEKEASSFSEPESLRTLRFYKTFSSPSPSPISFKRRSFNPPCQKGHKAGKPH